LVKTKEADKMSKKTSHKKSQHKSECETNKQIIENILTEIDCLLMDGGLSDENDDILKAAYDLLERVNC
jgi:hypothetical protein